MSQHSQRPAWKPQPVESIQGTVLKSNVGSLTSGNEGLALAYACVSNVLGLFSGVSLLLKKEAALIPIQQASKIHIL